MNDALGPSARLLRVHMGPGAPSVEAGPLPEPYRRLGGRGLSPGFSSTRRTQASSL